MISSMENGRFKSFVKLKQKKYRHQEKKFLVEGEHLVTAAIEAGVVAEILLCEGFEGNFSFDSGNFDVVCLSEGLFLKLAYAVTPQRVMAVCYMKEMVPEIDKRLLLVDDVQDPGNLGTLVRSAVAFGFDGVVLSGNCVDLYNDKVIRATKGALFGVPIVRVHLPSYVKDLQSSGVMVYGATLDGKAMSLNDAPMLDRMAFVLGNESNGISNEVLDLVDGNIFIRISSAVESLNVGVAGSIIMQSFNQV